jgi:hypothetical protein
MEMRRHADDIPRSERGLLTAYWALSGYGLRASRALAWLGAAMLLTIVLLMAFGLAKDTPKQTATGTVLAGGGKVTFEIDKDDPKNPTGNQFTGERFEKALNVTLNSVVFRSSGQHLTTAGTYIEMTSRLTDPSCWAWPSSPSATASNADCPAPAWRSPANGSTEPFRASLACAVDQAFELHRNPSTPRSLRDAPNMSAGSGSTEPSRSPGATARVMASQFGRWLPTGRFWCGRSARRIVLSLSLKISPSRSAVHSGCESAAQPRLPRSSSAVCGQSQRLKRRCRERGRSTVPQRIAAAR